MEERYSLAIVWKDYPPLNARNVWKVKGDITYEDGKLVFTILNGSKVRINPDQVERIFAVPTKEEIMEMIDEIKNKE